MSDAATLSGLQTFVLPSVAKSNKRTRVLEKVPHVHETARGPQKFEVTVALLGRFRVLVRLIRCSAVQLRPSKQSGVVGLRARNVILGVQDINAEDRATEKPWLATQHIGVQQTRAIVHDDRWRCDTVRTLCWSNAMLPWRNREKNNSNTSRSLSASRSS